MRSCAAARHLTLALRTRASPPPPPCKRYTNLLIVQSFGARACAYDFYGVTLVHRLNQLHGTTYASAFVVPCQQLCNVARPEQSEKSEESVRILR